MDRFIIENTFNIFLYFFFILITIKDFKEKIIPDTLTILIISLGLIKNFILEFNLEKSFLGITTYPVLFIFIYGYLETLFKKNIVGFGDIKLLMGIGSYFGYMGLYNLILFYNFIFISAFIYIIPKILLKKFKKNEEIPFAPFICLGTFIFQFLEVLWKIKDLFL